MLIRQIALACAIAAGAVVMRGGQACAQTGYYPHAGDIAQGISGVDIATGASISLEDYRGRWVYLEFWASTCGPCVELLPGMLSDTQQYRREGSLQMLFVTPEPESSRESLKSFVRQSGIDFPVLFYGDAKEYAARTWQVSGNPVGFLIDPEGRIVAKACGAIHCPQLLELFEAIHAGRLDPRLGLSCSWAIRSAGSSGELQVSVSSPDRTPVLLELDYRLLDIVFDPAGNVASVEKYEPAKRAPEWAHVVSFEDADHRLLSFPIAAGKYEGLEFTISARLDGIERVPLGQGLWTYEGGEAMFLDEVYFRECHELIVDRVP